MSCRSRHPCECRHYGVAFDNQQLVGCDGIVPRREDARYLGWYWNNSGGLYGAGERSLLAKSIEERYESYCTFLHNHAARKGMRLKYGRGDSQIWLVALPAISWLNIDGDVCRRYDDNSALVLVVFLNDGETRCAKEHGQLVDHAHTRPRPTSLPLGNGGARDTKLLR